MRKVKYVLTTRSLKSIYYALFHSHLIYCLIAYSCCNPKNIKNLALKQKQAIRLVAKAKYNAHTKPLFASLNILPLENLITLQQLQFLHPYEYNLLPSSFTSYFSSNEDRNEMYRLRNATELYVPRPRTENLKRFPFYTFPVLWNDTSDEIKSIISKQLFKKTIKIDCISRLSEFNCERLFCYACMN